MRPQYVYVMVAECGAVKIGISVDPPRRKRRMLANKTFKIDIVYVHPKAATEQQEKFCHTCLAHRRLAGEWFSITPSVAIDTVRGVVG